MIIRLIVTTAISLTVISGVQAQGDVGRGAAAFRQCAACHSFEPGRHLTGPSLAGVVGRKAGKTTRFRRYSRALKESDFSWTEKTLDQWLENPDKFVPGTSMRIRPIADREMRQDLIAFLKANGVSELENTARSGMPNLGQAQRSQQVTAIRYCPDAYWVTIATGKTLVYWEFNLRFKTDSSSNGPSKGQPVLVGQGMRGDRAQVIFSESGELSAFIRNKCTDV